MRDRKGFGGLGRAEMLGKVVVIAVARQISAELQGSVWGPRIITKS